MPYWTSWPDNVDAVAVADLWLFTGLVSRIVHAKCRYYLIRFIVEGQGRITVKTEL